MQVRGLEQVERVVGCWPGGGGVVGGEEGEVFFEEEARFRAGGEGHRVVAVGGGGVGAGGGAERGAETDAAFGDAVEDYLLETDEGAGEDEEDVVGADVVGFAFGGAAGGRAAAGGGAAHGAAGEGAVGWVVGVGAATVEGAGRGGFFLFGLDLDGGAFDYFQERLLHAFAADVFAVAYFRGGDLVDFI